VSLTRVDKKKNVNDYSLYQKISYAHDLITAINHQLSIFQCCLNNVTIGANCISSADACNIDRGVFF